MHFNRTFCFALRFPGNLGGATIFAGRIVSNLQGCIEKRQKTCWVSEWSLSSQCWKLVTLSRRRALSLTKLKHCNPIKVNSFHLCAVNEIVSSLCMSGVSSCVVVDGDGRAFSFCAPRRSSCEKRKERGGGSGSLFQRNFKLRLAFSSSSRHRSWVIGHRQSSFVVGLPPSYL